MDEINFTTKERTYIAEYSFAFSSDSLIKSEAVDVLKVMHHHNLMDNYEELIGYVKDNSNGIPHKIIHILRKKISQEQRDFIVKEYQGDYKSPLHEQEGI